MKTSLALRAAMLVVALLVMLAPVPYLARERSGTTGHHEHLTYMDALGEHGEPAERFVAVWWLGSAVALGWSFYAYRRGRKSRVVRGVLWAVVIAGAILVFIRGPMLSGHVDRLSGSGAIDLAALVYLLGAIAGAISEYTDRRVTE
jgi:hypothetical protein